MSLFDAGVVEGRRQALEDVTDRIDLELGPSVISVERAIVRTLLAELTT